MSKPKMDRTKSYLGDGVYARFDGYRIVLTTEDGISVTNAVVLEPDVYGNLVNYAKQFWVVRWP